MLLFASDELSYARTFYAWAKSLDTEDRKTATVAFLYQQLRREREPFYRALPNPSPRTVFSKNFKTFATIRKWLEERGWKISLRDTGWRNYVLFVFESCCPETRPDAIPPAPGQLKNPLLMKKFLNATEAPKNVRSLRTQEELSKLYEQIEQHAD